MNDKKKLTVLIADDEPHIRLMLKTVMKSMNTDVVGEAKNGSEAVELFKNEKPDISLFDINMPIQTGLDALQEIIKDYPDAFVIMMTSIANAETVEKCIECGASGYILKDTPITEMKAMIKEAWKEYKSSRSNG
ncbi:MAG: response regulator transcription factor [Desulfamplus sp.]|nr:response regulator transcription factor [Desulfamplus sp.]MBF0412262.1 response regulator transcription factor [Desulfamplus sp.]